MPRLPAQSWLAALLALLLTAGMAGQVSAQDGDSELAKELPAVSLPTMNSQGFVFDIDSSYNGTPGGTPQDAVVYAMALHSFDSDQTKDLAGKLGIEGDISDQGNDTYSISGDGGTLFVTPGLAQYVSAGESPEGELTGDDELIATAREWLRSHGQLPANVGEGSIQTKVGSPARASVIFQPVEPSPLLSSTPSVTVTVGPSNTVLEASWRWADLTPGDTYQLRPLDQAWTEVAERRSYVQASLPSDIYADGSSITGQAIYSSVSIAYAPSGIPGEGQFLQPVYVFTGKLTPSSSADSYAITAYVPALSNSNQPVG